MSSPVHRTVGGTTRSGQDRPRLVVLGLDEVGEVLGVLVAVVAVAVVVVVVVLGAEVLHLVDAAALGAALDGAVAGDLRSCSSSASAPIFFVRIRLSHAHYGP